MNVICHLFGHEDEVLEFGILRCRCGDYAPDAMQPRAYFAYGAMAATMGKYFSALADALASFGEGLRVLTVSIAALCPHESRTERLERWLTRWINS